MESTTIFDFYSETFLLPDGSYVNCEIIDTGGQEKFDAQNRNYYQRADCCLLVYDITNEDSFDAIEYFYVKEINNNCKKDTIVILLGNKTDLADGRIISQQQGADLAKKNKYIFMETSCEINYNVVDAFETLIIATNTEMIKTGQLKLNEKEVLKPFDEEEVEENNEALKTKEDNKRKKTKKIKNQKKKCC